MNLSCKNIIDYYFILFIILLLTSCYNCYGAIISKIEHAEIYENILKKVSHINAENNDNIIVLHGSLAWIYNIGSIKGKSGLPDFKANDLDFFVEGDFFYNVIEKLQEEIPKLNFKTLTIEESDVIWCSCYLEREHNKYARIADFVKTDNKFCHKDVFTVNIQDFNLITATAKWMINYEKNWINNLIDRINVFTTIIKEKGNDWLALSENSDSVYLIYKPFNKYNDHLNLCRLIIPTKIMELELTPEIKKSKLELDKSISSINTFLTDQWGIDDKTHEKYGENKVASSPMPENVQLLNKTTMITDVIKPNCSHNKNITGIKEKKKRKRKASVKHMDISSDSTLCKYSHPNYNHDNSKVNNFKYRVNGNKKPRQNSSSDDLLPELTNKFSSISLNGSVKNNIDLDSYYTTSNVNPFTYSFREKLYSKKGIINNKVSCVLNDLSHLHQKRTVQKIAALVIFALYFYYNIPIEVAQETVSILISHISELLMPAVRFSINSDYNWMITWPAFYTLLMVKYKRFKTKPIHALALGLLSVYSCIYTCKFASNFMPNEAITPCPLPDWLGEIQEIPEFIMSDHKTLEPDGKYHKLFVAHNTIASDKLTCDMIMHIEERFNIKSIPTNKKIIYLKRCGLIYDNQLSKSCYNSDGSVKKYKFPFINLIDTESERCQNKSTCVSARQFHRSNLEYEYIGGHTICCMRNNGKCTIPNKLNVLDKDNYTNILLNINAFKDMDLILYRLINLPENEGLNTWKEICELGQGNIHKITNLPIEGMYMLYNKDKDTIVSIICVTEKDKHIQLMSELLDLDNNIQLDIIVERNRRD